MPLDVIMPALGMAQETGHIVAWHKRPGDAVAEGDVLFEVETDKATMEVEAQAAGFLTDVAAPEGSEVPVGDVIARISGSAEAEGAVGATAPDAGLPEGHEVIMPTLGMAQDTGLLVAWAVAPGDKVAEGDTLFEVETDKATQEVEASAAGYVAALLAEAGEEVPTGQVIAILTAEAPNNPIRRSAAAGRNAAASSPKPAEDRAPEATAQPAKAVHEGGRILASPKLRRLAAERGLDLSLLVDAGAPQPYHMRDLDRLEALSQTAPQGTGAPATRRLTAEVPGAPFRAFAEWLSGTDVTEPAALATFAGAAFDALPATVAVTRPTGTIGLSVASDRLSETAPSDDPPDLVLRDLRATALTGVEAGAEAAPTVTLTRSGETLCLTLEYAAGALSPEAAIAGLSGLAARLQDPLRHLL